MEKLIKYAGKSEKGIFTYVIETERPHLVKTACEYHPEIAAYINAAKKIPGKTQILLTALGAGEYWGNNANGDYFAESALAYPGPEYGYRTFMSHAKAYKHHVNKDPKAAYGDVALAVYNPTFHRVELVVVLDNERAPDIVEKINNGEYPEWSMGCRVKFDICSICGNKARTRAEYCDHLRYYMGKLDPASGRMVYAINPQPVFFDISQVFIGADRVAKTLKKVASYGQYLPKHAEIEKEIPTDEPPASFDNLSEDIEELKRTDPPIPRETLNHLASVHPLRDILSTLTAARIVPKPHEFQRIVLVSLGHKPLADHWENQRLHFDPDVVPDFHSPGISSKIQISPDFINNDILDAIAPLIPHRSFSPHHVSKRIVIMVKRAHTQPWTKIASDTVRDSSTWDKFKQIGTAGLISLMYHKLVNEGAGKMSAKQLPSILIKYPKLAPLLGFVAMVAPVFFNKVFTPSNMGNYVKMNPDRQDFVERNMKRPVTNIYQEQFKYGSQGTTGLAMMFGAPIGIKMTSDYLQKKRHTDPEYREGSIKSFVRRYPEVAQIASTLPGLSLLTGRPIPTKIYNMVTHGAKKLEKAIPDFSKHADISDFALDTLVWPLAMGGPHLAHRLVGSAVDQTVFEGLKRLSNKQSKDKLK